MDKNEFKESLDVFLEVAKVCHKLHGFVEPVLAVLLDDEPQIIGVQWPDGKEDIILKLENWIKEDRLAAFIFVFEAESSDHLNFVRVVYSSPVEEIDCTATVKEGIIPVLEPWRRTEKQIFNYKSFQNRFRSLVMDKQWLPCKV